MGGQIEVTPRRSRSAVRSAGLTLRSVGLALRAAVLIAGVIGLTADASAAGRVTLAWDHSPDASVVGYRVMVGPAPDQYTDTFDVGYATSFVFQAPESRLYYFAVASYAAGPIVGTASAPVAAYPVEASPDVSTGAWPGSLSFYESLWGMSSGSGVRGLRAPVSSLTIAPDGRLFVVESNARLRVLPPNAALAQTVLTVGSGISMSSVALDPAFAQTGWIYLGETATNRTGGREFRVVRYRLLQNRAGERAVLISTPLGRSGNALFALSADRRIHVAVPGDNGSSALSDGAVLRFNVDGTVPAEQRGSSPVIAAGYYTPTAIAIDPLTQRAWVAGLDRSARPFLGVVPAGFADVPEWPAPLTAVSVDVAITSLAFAANQRALFAISSGGRLEQAWLGQDGTVGGGVPLTLSPHERAQAVATDGFGQPYVVVATGTEGAGTSSVLRVTPANRR